MKEISSAPAQADRLYTRRTKRVRMMTVTGR